MPILAKYVKRALPTTLYSIRNNSQLAPRTRAPHCPSLRTATGAATHLTCLAINKVPYYGFSSTALKYGAYRSSTLDACLDESSCKAVHSDTKFYRSVRKRQSVHCAHTLEIGLSIRSRYFSTKTRVAQEQMVRPERRVHVRDLQSRCAHPVHLALRQLEQILNAVRRRVAVDGGGEPL